MNNFANYNDIQNQLNYNQSLMMQQMPSQQPQYPPNVMPNQLNSNFASVNNPPLPNMNSMTSLPTTPYMLPSNMEKNNQENQMSNLQLKQNPPQIQPNQFQMQQQQQQQPQYQLQQTQPNYQYQQFQNSQINSQAQQLQQTTYVDPSQYQMPVQLNGQNSENNVPKEAQLISFD